MRRGHGIKNEKKYKRILRALISPNVMNVFKYPSREIINYLQASQLCHPHSVSFYVPAFGYYVHPVVGAP